MTIRLLAFIFCLPTYSLACDAIRLAGGVERNFVQTHTETPLGTLHSENYYTFGLVELDCIYELGVLSIGQVKARHGFSGGYQHRSDFTERGNDPVKSDSINIMYEIIF